MNFCLKFGKFSKFYFLILFSFLTKLLINVLFRLEYLHPLGMKVDNFSIIKDPVLNNSVLIYFIYYYFGYLLFSLIFLAKNYKKENNKIDFTKELRTPSSEGPINKDSKFLSFFFPNISKEKLYESLKLILLISFIYMVGEMIIGYLDQKNHTYFNFCMLQIFFIYLFLLISKKYKLYKHQILSFCLILFLGLGFKLISSLTKQCEYPTQDPNKLIDDMFKYIEDEALKESLKKNIINSITKINDEGLKSCKNGYSIFLIKTGDFYALIIIAILGYLIGNILHSFCIVNIKELINKKNISHYSLIFLIGFFGIIISIIALIISSSVSCGKYSDNNKRISFFCPITKNINQYSSTLLEYYFDNLISYKNKLHDILVEKNKYIQKDQKKKKDGIIEIIFTVLLPLLTFSKANSDFLIIKELGPFHILFPEILFQISKNVIIFIHNSTKNLLDNTQIRQFIFINIANINIFIGLCIYLELIELHFCNFDKDIKKNIDINDLNDIEKNEEGFIVNEIGF